MRDPGADTHKRGDGGRSGREDNVSLACNFFQFQGSQLPGQELVTAMPGMLKRVLVPLVKAVLHLEKEDCHGV